MMSKTISVGKNPTIRIDAIGGDVSIVGWDGDILVKGDDEDLRIEQNGDVVSLSCGGDLALRVPPKIHLLKSRVSVVMHPFVG